LKSSSALSRHAFQSSARFLYQRASRALCTSLDFGDAVQKREAKRLHNGSEERQEELPEEGEEGGEQQQEQQEEDED